MQRYKTAALVVSIVAVVGVVFTVTMLPADAQNSEAMTVKIRYKQPDGDTSSLLSVAVTDKKIESAELGFAAAVAEFGMLLRDSEHKGSSSFANARRLAEQFKGDDPYGHRAEFIRLIGSAEGVTRLRRRRSAEESIRSAKAERDYCADNERTISRKSSLGMPLYFLNRSSLGYALGSVLPSGVSVNIP
jgi:hypothetical protein